MEVEFSKEDVAYNVRALEADASGKGSDSEKIINVYDSEVLRLGLLGLLKVIQNTKSDPEDDDGEHGNVPIMFREMIIDAIYKEDYDEIESDDGKMKQKA